MRHDVFISHSATEKAVAGALCAGLEAKGIRCWIAPRDVLAGVPYGEAIIEAIAEARVMILVLSSGSNNSAQVMREVERAVSRGLPIIPFRIENVSPSGSLEYFLAGTHWLDAFTLPLENHIEQLTEATQRLLGRISAPERQQATKEGKAFSALTRPPIALESAGVGDLNRTQENKPTRDEFVAATPRQDWERWKESEPAGNRREPDGKGRTAVAKSKARSGKRLGVIAAAAFTVLLGLATGWWWYVRTPDRLPGFESRRLSGQGCSGADFSRDGHYLASACLQEVNVWDVATGDLVRTLALPVQAKKEGFYLRGSASSVAFSPDGRYLACGIHLQAIDDSAAAALWDVATWNLVHTFQDPIYNVSSVAFSADGRYLATGGEQASSPETSLAGIVKLWDPVTGTAVRIFSVGDYVHSVAFSPNGRYVVSGGGDGDYKRASLKMWDAGSGSLIHNLSGHTSMVNSVAFSPDGRQIVSGSLDKTIRLWDAEKGTQTRAPIVYDQGIKTVALSPGGKYLVSSSSDYKVQFWDVAKGTPVRTLPGEMYAGVALSHDGRLMATLEHEGLSVKLWH